MSFLKDLETSIAVGAEEKQASTPCGEGQRKRGCGDTVLIVKGFKELMKHKILGKEPPDWAQQRLDTCLECEFRTWLHALTWGRNFVKGGPLPIIHEKHFGSVLWCSECMCCIEAAILVAEKDCVKNLWPK